MNNRLASACGVPIKNDFLGIFGGVHATSRKEAILTLGRRIERANEHENARELLGSSADNFVLKEVQRICHKRHQFDVRELYVQGVTAALANITFAVNA